MKNSEKTGKCTSEHCTEICRISDDRTYLLPLLSRLEKMLREGCVTLAIDGPCGSGKTTLARVLSELYDCNVYHIDDFFLQGHQRTKERLSEVGGNFDRERFLSEVLLPHSKGEEVKYQKYDCSSGRLSDEITVKQKRLTVIEGSYSMHSELSPYYNLSVFMDISPEVQSERILKRNSPEMARNFFEKWIPMENEYFRVMRIKERCDIVINTEQK